MDYDNLILIIEIVSFTADNKNSSTGAYSANSRLISKILDLGVRSDVLIKKTVLGVLKYLFEKNAAIVKKEDMKRLGSLIFTSVVSDDLQVRLLALGLMKNVIRKEYISLVEEPDLIF